MFYVFDVLHDLDVCGIDVGFLIVGWLVVLGLAAL